MALGDRINKYRIEAGYSQEALAKELGVSRQSVFKWEKGESVPDVNKIILLSEILSVSIDELLSRESDEEIAARLKRANEARKRAMLEEEEKDRERLKERISLNRYKTIAVSLFQVAVLSALTALAVFVLTIILQNKLFPAEDEFFVFPTEEFIKTAVKCALCIAFSTALYRLLYTDKNSLGLCITALTLVAVSVFIDFIPFPEFDYSESEILRLTEMNAIINIISVVVAFSDILFVFAGGMTIALKKFSPEACVKEKMTEEKQPSALTAVFGVLVGFLGTPYLWGVSFITVNKLREKFPSFFKLFTRFQVIGMIAEVFAVVLVFVLVYVTSAFKK